MSRLPRLAAAAALVIELSGCVTITEGSPGQGAFRVRIDDQVRATVPAQAVPSEELPEQSPRLSERQVQIVQAAETLLSTQNYFVGGQRYSYDCTGTILAIYAMAGVRLLDLFPRFSGAGVERLYAIAESQDLLYHSDLPQPGDLIFWDNTYDKNGDTQWNDWLTHVGLVLSVSEDGTIEYVHHDYRQGAVRARMSLLDPETHLGPDGVVVNSPMRMRSHRYLNPDEWLASHLYGRLGAMHQVEL